VVIDRARGPDPVRARRARIARAVRIAKGLGYLALLIAVVAFVTAAATDFPSPLVSISVGALIAGCVVLPLPIIVGYGIRAAEREERSGSSAHRRPQDAGPRERERSDIDEEERSGSSAHRRPQDAGPSERERSDIDEEERSGRAEREGRRRRYR
jgi:hypothetical protein